MIQHRIGERIGVVEVMEIDRCFAPAYVRQLVPAKEQARHTQAGVAGKGPAVIGVQVAELARKLRAQRGDLLRQRLGGGVPGG
jgi:hypothetical protein